MTASTMPGPREWRHHLHSQPETGFAETDTAAFLAGLLRTWGYEVVEAVGGTGVVASMTRGSGGSRIGIRADMDALAISEHGSRPYASTRAGAMHACGHDGHMAMALGAAQELAGTSADAFTGTVRFVFQPAEEHGRGAQAMLDDGLLDRFPMDAIYGLHNLPGIAASEFHVRPGAIMASEDNFEIVVTGEGGHAARPHMLADPLVAGAQIVVALQSVVARNVDPQSPAVVSCTEFITDGTRNVVPTTVVIRGDTRSFSAQVQALLEERIRQLAEGIAKAHGSTCTVAYTHEFRPTVNDEACTRAAAQAARTALGNARVVDDCAAVMASEDFAVLLESVPGCFAFIGNGDAGMPGGVPLHSPRYDFNDDILQSGIDYYVALVRQELAPAPWWHAHARDAKWSCEAPSADALDFHRALDGYQPTPLVDLPDLAAELGVARVLAKDESSRLGLPAFKALGASWAIHRCLQGRTSTTPATIVTATDGNHGRAVARFARLLGHRASIVIPTGVHPSAVQAIVDEGAAITMVDGTYDEAVATAAAIAAADDDAILVQDTAWDGYEEVPGWIVEGYATLFAEVDEQLRTDGIGRPDLVAVPTGVGSLLQGALAYYRSARAVPGTTVVSVEPDTAACVLASLPAGRPVTVDTDETIMAGLNCGTPSSLAWPYIANGLDAAVAVTDADDARAAHDLARLGVAAGPCGAAGLAAMRRALTGEGSDHRRAHLGIDHGSIVVLLVTEGSAANPAPSIEEA